MPVINRTPLSYGIGVLVLSTCCSVTIAPLLVSAAQTSDGTFDVASIRQNDSSKPPGTFEFRSFSRNGAVVITNMSLLSIIRVAYGFENVVDLIIENAPAWTRSVLYDIQARGEPDPRDDRIASYRRALWMVRSLLRDRFALKVRQERREAPILALTLTEGFKLGPDLRRSKPNSCRESTSPESAKDSRPICGLTAAPDGLIGTGSPLSVLAISLSSNPTISRIVEDRTGLEGAFDFTLKTSSEWDIRTALREQLGLRLQEGTALRRVLIIESVDRPTPN